MVLVSDSWFIITALIAPSYDGPSFKKSKVSEFLCGESGRVLKIVEDWVYLEQEDGYQSWVKTFYGYFNASPFNATHMIVSKGDLPFGTRVLIKNETITLSNKKSLFSNQKTASLLIKPEPENLIDLAKSLIGCPYRWGGKSSTGFDCSGFIQTVCLAAGIRVPRDSTNQRDFFSDTIIKSKNSEPGDIHIFGEDEIINHVGFSTGGYGIIHCQGWVKEETLDNNYIDFNKELREKLVSSHSLRLKFSR
tara:strand:- start:1499 stop:2245 length:747 start_codon:yes stop_codon:yes gene_type:complete